MGRNGNRVGQERRGTIRTFFLAYRKYLHLRTYTFPIFLSPLQDSIVVLTKLRPNHRTQHTSWNTFDKLVVDTMWLIGRRKMLQICRSVCSSQKPVCNSTWILKRQNYNLFSITLLRSSWGVAFYWAVMFPDRNKSRRLFLESKKSVTMATGVIASITGSYASEVTGRSQFH